MIELIHDIKKCDDATLWSLVTDLTSIIQRYTFSTDNEAFMVWFRVYKCLDNEINMRMMNESMEV